MLPVLITIDTEYSSALYRQGPGRDRTFNFDRAIACRSRWGECGIFYQMDRLERHGLKGVFFVDPMPAMVWGQKAVDEVVQPILARGHGVQLHLHPEWLELADRNVAPVGGFGRNIAEFPLTDQRALLEYAIERLVEAGADRPIAFRAGNYGADDNTLRVLSSLGLLYDSSFPAGIARSPCAISLPPGQLSPVRHHGVTELPIGAIAARGGALRHAQITALSRREMKEAIIHAADSGWPLFVLVSHSFELFDRTNGVPNWLVRRRFDKLCEWLETSSVARSARFVDLPELLEPPPSSPEKLAPLPHQPLRSAMRMAEQYVVNKLHSWRANSAMILYFSAIV